VNFMTLSMRRVVHVAKLCIEIPDSLYEWLRDVSREMATTPEALITPASLAATRRQRGHIEDSV
jgi:hypothetical protein